ncbi:MAG: YfhO family protein [Butyricicoccus sp.]|nr:YfhO family protein [Butyricicoccus sp.]
MRRFAKCSYPLLLLGLIALWLVLLMSSGFLFGSEIDWYCQHIALAETIRTECIHQHTLAPAFLPLGGGTNGYQFAYYGYFRPDILIGYLLPQVPMTILVPLYLIVGYIAATLLCYALLRNHKLEPFWAFLGSVLFLSAACFFHLHRQIMFVNFLPFFLAALLAIRKGKTYTLPLWFFLICIHSFYYAPACILIAGWYWYQQEGTLRFWKKYLGTAILGTAMAAMLLLPTGLAILEHRRASAEGGLLDILAPNLTFKGLLYSNYGIGLTAICLYALLLGLSYHRFRRDSIVYLVVTIWNLASYLLNGTLYTRPKILIPFLPLLVLHTVCILRALFQREIQAKLWPGIVLLGALIPYLESDRLSWLAADVLLVIGFMVCTRYVRQPAWYGLLLVLPYLLSIQTSQTENFAAQREASAFSAEEYQQVYQDTRYRFDSLKSPLDQCNRLDFAGQKKSTMYSSVTNSAYNTVFFDVLQTPIRVNNRTAMVAENNPFLLRLMGVRYIQTPASKVPAGYTIIEQRDNVVLAENPSVLPIAYGTTQTMGQEQFDGLSETAQLEAITTHAIVPEAPVQEEPASIQAVQPSFTEIDWPDSVQVEETENGYQLHVTKESTVSLAWEELPADQILLLDFTVDNHTRRAVEITVNGIRNRLSNAAAPYPNGNDHFHYQISGADGVSELRITLTKGDYTIRDVRWQQCPLDLLTEQQITSVESSSGEGLISGSLTMEEDGYLVTSIPLQHGMQLFIDGEETPIERVNLAFVGAKLSAGRHTVRLEFTPPGQQVGYGVSLLAFVLFGFTWYRRKGKRNDEAKT